MLSVIEISKVRKSFGNKEVIKELTLNVKRSTVLGVVGENGVGKTTLFKSILGILRIDAGEIRINGKNISQGGEALVDIGFLLEPRYYSYLSTYDNLKEILLLSGAYGKSSKKDIENILDFLNLSEVKHKKINKLSFGMKQRVGLAQALIAKPTILLLDEPLIGLDPTGSNLFKEKIAELHKNYECTIILSGHQLSDIQEVCEEVAVLGNGQILVHDKIDNLVEKISAFVFENPIPEIKRETARVGKCAYLSDDKKTLYIKQGVQEEFRLISELYAEYRLIDVMYSQIGLERFFGKENGSESIKK